MRPTQVFVSDQARTSSGEQLRPGEKVRVESLDGLVLTVHPEHVGSSA